MRVVYRELFDREPHVEEVAYWRPRLAGGEDWGVFLWSALQSEEYQGHLLGRLKGLDADVTVDLRPEGLCFPPGPIRIEGAAADQSVLHTIVASGGSYEPHVLAAIARALRPGQTAIDVGANIGVTAAVSARAVGARGRVVAVEASPSTFEYLRRNLVRNGLSWAVPVNVAAWESDTTLLLEHADIGPGGSRVYASEPERDDGPGAARSAPVKVAARSVDSLLGELGLDETAVGLIKLDIEGGEAYALRGAARTIERGRPTLVVEANPSCLAACRSSVADLFATIAELDYDVRVLGSAAERSAASARSSGPVTSAAELAARFDGPGAPAVIDLVCLPREGASMPSETRSHSDLLAGEAEPEWASLAHPFEFHRIPRPFKPDGGHSTIGRIPDAALEALGGDVGWDDERVVLVEGRTLLRRPCEIHDEIRELGSGRYSLWGSQVYLSSTDGSDPMSNERIYYVGMRDDGT